MFELFFEKLGRNATNLTLTVKDLTEEYIFAAVQPYLMSRDLEYQINFNDKTGTGAGTLWYGMCSGTTFHVKKIEPKEEA